MRIPFRRYWSLLARHMKAEWRLMLLLALTLLGGIGLQLANPQIVRGFIDMARAGASSDRLVSAALLFLGLALVQQLLALLASYAGQTVAWRATNALRRELTLHCLRLDLGFHHARTPGELVERIDGDISALANFFSQMVILVLGNLLLLSGILLILFHENWRVGLAFALLAGAGLLILTRLYRRSQPQWVLARQGSAELAGYIEERLAGTEDIRSSGATDYKLRRLYQLMRQLMERYRGARLTGHVAAITGEFFSALALAAGLALGAQLYVRGQVTVGTVYLFSHYALMLALPLRTITDQLEDLQRAGASLVRVEELAQTPILVQDGPGVPLPAAALEVEFEQVAFGYAAQSPVLHNLSLRLAPGQVLGLLGRTGSGKSTIARLLFRLYDPSAGAIRLGGVDIRMARLDQLRQRVGMVTQEVQLFHATLRDNLTFFDRGIADEQILGAIDLLGLRDWYDRLPDGLATQLEAGGGLSAGEAQLLALTRVFLSDPGLLILDEASSRLDPATEHLLEQALDRLLQGRTAIIIAHRLATIQRADQIVILEAGRIVEHGPRQRLAADPTSRFAGLLRVGLEEALA